MNRRWPRVLKDCKFADMTRAEYDERLRDVLSLAKPQFMRAAGLLPDGTPDLAAMMAAVRSRGSAGAGMPEFFDSIYRTPERTRTQAREMARRLRQKAAA